MGLIESAYSVAADIRIVAASILLLPILCFAISTLRYRYSVRRRGWNHGPPVVPYTVPLLFHTIAFGWSPIDFVTNTIARYGWRDPLRVRMGWFSFTIVTNPEHIQTIFRSSKHLHSTPAVIFALKYLLQAPESALAWYEADNSGMANTPLKGSTTKQVNRIHFHQAHSAQKFLSNQHLWQLSRNYLGNLNEDLKATFSGDSQGWVEFPDLYRFLQMNVTRAMIRALMGPGVLETSPTFIEDFWTFDNHVPKLLRGLPRWLMPKGYAARDRLLQNIKTWHARAHDRSDCSRIGDEDPEWEPHFGSKLVRARQDYALKMDFMNADARASEDLGLLMASNGNAVPCVFWFIYEALKLEGNSGVRQRGAREVAACVDEHGGLDIQKLNSQPLLQSMYAEVLRLRVGIGMARQSESEPFHLGGYQIPKDEPFVIFSRHPALNAEAWTMAGRPPAETAPLEQYCPERFLVPKTKTKKTSDSKEEEDEDEFSMNGLAGLWLPYGGGQRMCPGRHFAKNEIIGTYALLTHKYEMELLDSDRHQALPDLRWFPSGALPPVGKIPFRIRRRVRSEASSCL